jgi:hypothetical protein
LVAGRTPPQKPNEKNRLCVAQENGDCRLGLTKRVLVIVSL